ncbi:Uncharacterised protein (plasmid) [Tsukamurella tyrosinosolvens]|uniref:Uncharacterized protein n=1 Tax=Tsukamurella tyrosinosolvens TaxID=57704 RepID=A0A1H4I777_TSUTY|nr:hypothetical protein SAMN04489793_0048 [Tsukamurella tyrosinosolvens]VEH95807.1 Uncharacterised protein [Tsukamurella tyrosinosolvens]
MPWVEKLPPRCEGCDAPYRPNHMLLGFDNLQRMRTLYCRDCGHTAAVDTKLVWRAR